MTARDPEYLYTAGYGSRRTLTPPEDQVLPAVQAFCAAQTSGQCSTGGGGEQPTTSDSQPSSQPTDVYPSKSTEEPPSYPTKEPTYPPSSAPYTTTTPAPGYPTHKPNESHPTTKVSPPPVTAGAALAGSVGGLAMVVMGALAAF